MKSLFRYAGAIPYLIAVFLNATIDLGHKIVLQNSLFKLYDGSQQVLLTAVVNGLILLPFILLLSPSGFISDRFAKHHVLRGTAWAALGLTCLITCFYYLGWFWLAFTTTFLLAAQSAIYSPAKYSYLKLVFGKERLAEGNGLVQSITIIAILAGTFLFSILFEMCFPEDATSANEVIRAMAPAGWALITAAFIELILCYRLPALDEGSKDKTFLPKDYFSGKLTKNSLSVIADHRNLRLSILGLSMFWGLGQVLLASYPAYAKEFIGVTNTIMIQGTLACTGIGIALGSLLAGKVSRGYIETGLIPLGALGITVCLWMVPNISSVYGEMICFLAIGFFGGLFIVPLNTLIQFFAKEDQIGQVVAANNWVQNVCMLSLLVAVFFAATLGANTKTILLTAAGFSIVGSIYTVSKLPQSLVRFLLGGLVQRYYSIRVEGMKNIPEDQGVLLLGNHVSWMDWAIVQIACPRPIRFVMAKKIYDRWYLNRIFRFFGCIPIAPGSSSQKSLEHVAELLNEGHVVCLFPEGTLSRTGNLVEFRGGFERACDLAEPQVRIVPFHLRGLWGSPLSYAKGTLKKSAKGTGKRDVIVGFGKSLPNDISAAKLKQKVFDLSTETWHSYAKNLPNLTQGCAQGLARSGGHTVAIDLDGKKYSGAKLLAGAMLFSSRMRRSSGKHIGLILPMNPAAVIANVGALMANKPPVNLNYTATTESLIESIRIANITQVFTSKAFLEKLGQLGIDLSDIEKQVEFVFMEDVSDETNMLASCWQYAKARLLPSSYFRYKYRASEGDSTAAVLFSSGSEGAPKGIELSHTNIMSNIKQITEVLDPQQGDILMASLPPFHALGLSVTLFMPVVEGIKFVCQPDPTNARATAKLIAEHKATMLFGSSTFLRLYVQDTNIYPLMLDSLRVVVAGAEKLRENVANGFRLKFGKEILEGYGATETSPVASVNVPDRLGANKAKVQIGRRLGSVGMPLPGTGYKIVDPDTWEELAADELGMVLIAGPQVMTGYLDAPESTDAVIKELDGMKWYVTGDKGKFDSDGFLWIVDRYSRFAKIGGEMVSLGTVETIAQAAHDAMLAKPNENAEILATISSDEKKGEVIVLLASIDIDLAALRQGMLEQGATALMLPERIIQLAEIPKLGSGKVDYKQAKTIAEEHRQESTPE